MLNNELELKFDIGQEDYYKNFWNIIRNKNKNGYEIPRKFRHIYTNTVFLPEKSCKLLNNKIKEKSIFRNIANVVSVDRDTNLKLIYYSENKSMWLGENALNLEPQDVDKPKIHRVKSYNLSSLVRMSEDAIVDESFLVEEQLTNDLSRKFASEETKAFINGDGNNMPKGILFENEGAKIGVETNKLLFDDLKRLYFGLNNEYRENACWLMNDKTALYISELKDENGNYLWNMDNKTLLGKPVYFVKEMPDLENGSLPIIFGDFSYYWIFERHIPTIKVLRELYAPVNQVGFLAYEFLDAKLVNRDAIKVLKIND